MITLENRKESRTHDPFVLDYRKARTALVLHLAAILGIACRQYPRDLFPGSSGVIELDLAPRTPKDFGKLRDLLSALRDHSLLPWLSIREHTSLTPRERDWLADYGLCERTEENRP